jgi:hypothetical protein
MEGRLSGILVYIYFVATRFAFIVKCQIINFKPVRFSNQYADDTNISAYHTNINKVEDVLTL